MKRALIVLLATAALAPAADLYVAPNGQDANAGRQTQPFATIGRAAAVAQPGDTVHVATGTYRETVKPQASGQAGRPIRYLAEGTVTVSGAEALTGTWQRERNGVWSLATPLRFVQLLCDGRMMPEARWPNVPLDDIMAMPRATAGPGTDYTGLADPKLPPGDWNGAVVLLWPGSRWSNYTRRVTQYQAGQSFRFDQTLEQARKDPYHQQDPYRPTAGNPYLLYGVRAALDSPGEWLLDEAAGRVLFISPDDRAPADHALEVKQRPLAFDLKGLGYIELSGFRVVAAAMDLTDAHDCQVVDCHLRWIDHVREFAQWRTPGTPNQVTGRNNVLRRCSFGHAPLTALRVAGQDNRLDDCVFFNLNYLGSSNAGLDLGRSVGVQVNRCRLGRTGRDTIGHHGAKHQRIEYCELWQTNLLNNDSGAIYCWGTDSDGGVVAHNWIHDNLGDSTVGVYLDNFSKNFVVHHNLIWNSSGSGIRLNSDAVGHLVANNTVLRSREPFGTYCYAAYTPTMKGTRIVNNLVDERLKLRDPQYFVQGALGPEVHHNLVGAMDADGVPTADSAAVDAGCPVPGVTDGFRGQAPDVGAYEVGGERWTAGATWRPADEPRQAKADLSFRPLPPLTEQSMLTAGLQLWLDAADAASVTRDGAGRVTGWADKSPARRALAPRGGGLNYVPSALGGRAVVRGDGKTCLPVGTLRAALGPVSVFLVAQGVDAAGPSWQRLCGAWIGGQDKQDWLEPNWMIGRAGGAKPAAFEAQLFWLLRPKGFTLDHVMVFGPGTESAQYLLGDVAELLIYDRALRPSEADAVTEYLTRKWGLKP